MGISWTEDFPTGIETPTKAKHSGDWRYLAILTGLAALFLKMDMFRVVV